MSEPYAELRKKFEELVRKGKAEGVDLDYANCDDSYSGYFRRGFEAGWQAAQPTPEINDKNGWVYDPGKALANLRRAEAAEAKLAAMPAKWEQAARRIAEIIVLPKSDPVLYGYWKARVLEILREELGK